MTRILFLLGVLFAIPVVYLRKFIPESPRWLIYNGKYNEALKIVDLIEMQCSKIINKESSKSNDLNQSISADISKHSFEQSKTQQSNGNIEENSNLNEEDQILLNCTFEETDSPLVDKKHKNKNFIKDNIRSEITIGEILHIFLKKYPDRFFYGITLMASQAFFYYGIFYTYTNVLIKFYSVKKDVAGLFIIPLSLASFLGPVFLGQYFDSWSRRKMIFLTFSVSGLLLVATAINFYYSFYPFFIQQTLWFLVFFVASPAASSAHLTVSEIFPLEMRSQAMAIFFSCGLGIGGIIAPLLYGTFINESSKISIFISYLFTSFIMITAGFIGLFFGINSENKSLEEISENMRDDFS